MTNVIENLKGMMRSCYTYGSLNIDSRYIKPYSIKLGADLFTKVYDEYSKHLLDNYTIKTDVYTDGEGCTYNELIKK